MKNVLQRFLPKKTHFMGVDIGTHQIKVAEIKVHNGLPEVVALRRCPTPPGVWTDQFDEEALVQALREVASPHLKEVITCIGGEKLVSRIVRMPRMTNKEMDSSARFEIQKFVPTPVDQLIIRHVRLEEPLSHQEESSKSKIFAPRNGGTKESNGSQEEGQNVLLLAVPAATIYRYHSIFSRAGMVVAAVDLKAFALWRLYGRSEQGTVAIADIGLKTSQLVLVRDGLIQFIRLLPAGGEILTNYIVDIYGVDDSEAHRMKEEAAATLEEDLYGPGPAPLEGVIQEVLPEITKELRRTLEYYTQDNVSADRLVLSGGTGNLEGLAGYLQDALGMPVEVGVPRIDFDDGVAFDPAFAVAIGLAVREVAG